MEWNRAAEDMFGLAADDAMGQPLKSLHLPEDLEWQPLLDQARATRLPQRSQIAALSGSGAERYVQFSIAPLPGWGGAGGGILLLGEDVTAQVRARMAAEQEAVHLAQRAAEIQALRDTAIALSSSLDQDEVLRVVCERGRKLLAADFAAALVPYNDPHWMEGGTPAGTEAPSTGEPLTALLRRVLPGAETLVTRRFPAIPLVLPGGEVLPRWEGARSGVAVPLRNAGQIQGVVIFGWRSPLPVRGEGVRVAEALGAHASLALRNARLYDDMKQAAERRDRFFSAMSHDLRTPITAIVGYSELLLDGIVGDLGARQLEMVDRISQVAGHLSQLVNDILDLAKLEAGKMEFHRESIRLEALVEDAAVAIEPQADSKGLVLLRELDEVRDAVLRVDRVRVRQVLVNVLSNAVKFTPAGEVRISASIEPERMWIAVRDTGPGLGDGDHEAL
ncbi:MAG: hypothetical protein AVDCRST_MAG89-2573, partial [uncultured Gemmatimonadetes bacterium]